MAALTVPAFTFVDTAIAVLDMLGGLRDLEGEYPALFLDIEGHNLGRNGTVSLVTLLYQPTGAVFLIDVTTLGRVAFTTTTPSGTTLQSILEAPKIVKVFFDILSDSHALFAHFQVRVAGIHDLQLMASATRRGHKVYFDGLAKCIWKDSVLPYKVLSEWSIVKEAGKRLFAPDKGGSYDVFDCRPPSDAVALYCVQDVTILPNLWRQYAMRGTESWWKQIEESTEERIILSQGDNFCSGPHLALAPSDWLFWNIIDRPWLHFRNAHSYDDSAPVEDEPQHDWIELQSEDT